MSSDVLAVSNEASAEAADKDAPMGRKDKGRRAEGYRHPEASALLRPDVGTQAQFRKKKKPATWRYDPSLSPALDWDGENPARERAEAKIAALQERIVRLAATIGEANADSISNGDLDDARKELTTARAEVDELKALSKPFLNWAGKAERLSFDVPTLPLFVHERLSTAAIVETLKGHKRDRQPSNFDLFGESDLPIHDRLLKAYEHRDGWVNRLVLGDSLVVMNSLLHYEGLGGQVQTIYMDPPYAVKFGSNFQPFVRKRDVTHGADDDMPREPEMVQAYRDTWELGVHSFLTYLRDRLLLARELLHPSGSIFVQMSDTNLHPRGDGRSVRGGVLRLADQLPDHLGVPDPDAGDPRRLPAVVRAGPGTAEGAEAVRGTARRAGRGQRAVGAAAGRQLPGRDGGREAAGSSVARGRPSLQTRQSSIPSAASEPQPFKFESKVYKPGATSHWKPSYPGGLEQLAAAGRIHVAANSIQYRRFASDFPYKERAISGRTRSPAASRTRRCTSSRLVPRWSSAAC